MEHIPVLLNGVLDSFKGCQLSVFVDGTLGAGGHSNEILRAHPEIERHIGIDQDPTARALAKETLAEFSKKLSIVPGNFNELRNHLKLLGIDQVDGILLDIGVSSMQIDQADRGFSFMKPGPLDMRMDPTATLTAAEICNEWDETEIARVLWRYGEERYSRRIARAIVDARPLSSTEELADIASRCQPRSKKGIHPATRTFQGLRIAVNRELEVLEKVLPEAIDLLNPGGRLAVITFHSLEDRIVKQLFRDASSDKVSTSGLGGLFLDKEPTVTLLTRKPVIATDEETARNPRSRSAKLRVIEKR